MLRRSKVEPRIDYGAPSDVGTQVIGFVTRVKKARRSTHIRVLYSQTLNQYSQRRTHQSFYAHGLRCAGNAKTGLENIHILMTLKRRLATAAAAIAPRIRMRNTSLVFCPDLPCKKGVNSSTSIFLMCDQVPKTDFI